MIRINLIHGTKNYLTLEKVRRILKLNAEQREKLLTLERIYKIRLGQDEPERRRL